MQKRPNIIDPIEKIVRTALDAAGISYQCAGENHFDQTLDFYLPDYGTFIEVKQFHSERISRQMAQAPNIIAIQGRGAAETFARMISKVAPR